jgi:hypothetical protein
MPDGWQTLITFSTNTTFSVWEKAVKPPGLDGKEPIDTTTMHNKVWRTFDARHLKTLTEATAVCAYDPDIYNIIPTLINVPQTVTVTFPEHTTVAFYGYLYKFEVKEHKEGEFPEADLSIMPTNWDPVGFGEAAPTVTMAPGT